MNGKRIGIIGGSGLYEMKELAIEEEVRVETPFGEPSDKFILGTLMGKKVAFLPRHGKGHRILPSQLNFRANIFGMKKLGVAQILSVSAVGSMKEEIEPGHIVIPDQFFDQTKNRISTFFGNGVVGHASFADPVCGALCEVVTASAKSAGATVHKGGTYICIEGPLFSTRGESNIYRKWGVDVIGMTNVTEAKLAREAGVCYSTIALATDYDCWYAGHEEVTVEAVIRIIHQNVEMAQKIIKNAVGSIDGKKACACADAMKNAIMTNKDMIPEQTRKDLEIILNLK
ncbi:MAG: S-methyl-5'-thioadenosine phosphorylase [Nitrospinae bacterium]|nr:S-methyl-5'-thioadenosine phosphorylase [Nitrospinota bacterium]